MELLTTRLLLRELAEEDAADANAYESDPEVVLYEQHDLRSMEESRAYIERVLAESRESPRRVYDLAVVRRDDARMIGRCGLKVTNPDQREAALWYILRRDEWRRGYATEAARAVLGFGFDELGLHRIFVDVDPRNVASIRVAEKLGMRREAHFVENLLVKGEWTDSIILALLDREHTSQEAGPGAACETHRLGDRGR
jgi:RimJ/RimL family protein N-acetyltransferase